MCRLGGKKPQTYLTKAFKLVENVAQKVKFKWRLVEISFINNFSDANASREAKIRVCSAERKPEWRESEIRTSSDMCSAPPSLIIHYLLFTLFFTPPVVNAENLLRCEPSAARRAGLFPPKSLFRVYIWRVYDVQAFNVLTNQFISIQTARCWKWVNQSAAASRAFLCVLHWTPRTIEGLIQRILIITADPLAVSSFFANSP